VSSVVAIAKSKQAARKQAANSPFIDMKNEENYIIGDVEQVIIKMKEYITLGVEYFILRFVDFPNTVGVKMFSEEVIPKI
jgi:alkanesulfonate monooxygenase SsuD/methylene tetrahydromethanopterin reductase-like flavin-dependent oxidoreductase (luciferase family)